MNALNCPPGRNRTIRLKQGGGSIAGAQNRAQSESRSRVQSRGPTESPGSRARQEGDMLLFLALDPRLLTLDSLPLRVFARERLFALGLAGEQHDEHLLQLPFYRFGRFFAVFERAEDRLWIVLRI